MNGVSRRVSSGHLVGRDAELAVGQASLRQVFDGGVDHSAQVLLISGEAGMGKTRLLDELLDRARNAGAVTACGRCLEHGSEIRPLTAVTEILAELGPTAPSPGSAADAEKPPGGRSSWTEPGEAMAHLFDHARSMLRNLSNRGPLVVAIEDLHWSDQTTRELLMDLVRTRGLERVLLICTYRSDELHRRHPLVPLLADLEYAVRPDRIELAPLAEADLIELASAVLGEPISEHDGRELSRRSGGNPFYAEELLAVDDPGVLPTGVRHVVLARSQSLAPDAVACLQAASTLAHPIDPDTLQATTGLETGRFRRAVDTLCRDRFLVEDDAELRFRHELVREVFLDDLLPGERSELFARAARALQQHQPERLGEIARLHLNAAQLPEALQSSVQAAQAASAIGASAEAGRNYGRAIDLWDRVDAPAARAGMSHLRLLREAAKVADLSRNFDVAVQLARRAAAEANLAGDRLEEGTALFELSGYLWNATDPGMTDAIERAMAVLPRDPPTVARARLEVRAAMKRVFAGERTEADLALEAAAKLAAALGERGVEATARAHIGLWRAGLGDEIALQNLRDGSRVAYSIDDGAAGTIIAINLTHVLHHLGRFDEVVDLHGRWSAFAERHGLAITRGIIFEGNVLLALEALGRWDEAESIVNEIGRRLSPESMGRWASAFLGWTQIQLNRGHYADVVSSYRRGLEMCESGYYSGDLFPIGTGLIELTATGMIDPIDPDTIESWIDCLKPDEAWLGARLVATVARHMIPPPHEARHDQMVDTVNVWTERLERMSREFFSVPPVLEAWLSQIEAEVAESSGDPRPDHWAHLVSTWDELRCPFFAAGARYRQADALLRAGGGRSTSDRRLATRLLTEAGGTATDLQAKPLYRSIEDLARRARLRLGDDSADKPATPSESSPFGLTSREFEVLRLVNDGRSNGEIGAELFISTKTASVHVSNILRKLGAANRIEASAIARRHELLDH